MTNMHVLLYLIGIVLPRLGCISMNTWRTFIKLWLELHIQPIQKRLSFSNFKPYLKPVTDEQVFYDKFLCDKFYLLVCTRNFDKFLYDKCT
jgi:hypothetical protein